MKRLFIEHVKQIHSFVIAETGKFHFLLLKQKKSLDLLSKPLMVVDLRGIEPLTS